ncbi:MAG: NERD domain-containing protein [Clostridiales bacterium]|nr:NERD domain-containing protein [Clostridiales bacterium]
MTYKKLKKYETDGGKFLFNCYLPKDDGTTTEIDVILIHSSGIFVIESKNYSGWIFGNEKDKMWTQTLRSNGGKVQKKHFYNPIMQNNAHLKWLKTIVGKNVPVYSLIAFSERCTLKNVTLESTDIVVINRQHIYESVKYMGNRSIQALSKMDIDRIYEMLYPYTQTTEYERQQHIDNILTAQHKTNDNIVSYNINRICPKCGAELVLRTAKKGKHVGEQFYGCSNYPKCRYTSTTIS